MKILAALDNEDTIHTLKSCLVELAYTDVVYVKDISDVDINIPVEELNLLIVDHQLNTDKGLDFIRQFREMNPGMKVPAALMTEEMDQNQSVRTIITNSIDYSIQKPVTVMGLVRLFSKVEE